MTYSASPLQGPASQKLQAATTLELAQALVERLTITDSDWHQLKNNRQARSCEQTTLALLFLLRDQPQEALPRLQQATGWLDHSISVRPCPTHGSVKGKI